MEALPKKLLPLILFGIAVTSLFSVQPAQAYSVTLEQVGANVVANGSGPINLTGLTFQGSVSTNGVGLLPLFGIIFTGPTGRYGAHPRQHKFETVGSSYDLRFMVVSLRVRGVYSVFHLPELL